MKNPAKKLAIGTLFAAAAGYIAGILTAPKSGKETRDEIKASAQHAWSEGEKQLKQLHTELNTVLNQARQESVKLKGAAQKQYEESLDNAKKVKEKARVLLSAIHEGDTEDKDLQNAIKEAKTAIEHVKSYLKKA